MSNDKYSDWIDRKYPTPDSARDQCQDAVRKMLIAFPELEIRVGRCNGIFHRWLVEEESHKIIDPTFRQFNHPLNYDKIKLSIGSIILGGMDEV